MPVTEMQIEAFQRDGAVLLGGLLADHVEALREAVAANMANPGPFERTYEPADGTAPFFQDFCNWSRIDGYRRAVTASPMAEAAARLMRSRTARIFHDHVLVKEPGADVPTPWHQDQPYYCVDGSDTVSLWIPLDPVPRERTLEFVAGSHRWGKYFRPERFNKTALNENDGLEPVPDIEGNRESYDILGWALEPGDAVAFNYMTLHGAPANTSKVEQRRAFSLRLLGDDVRFARREGVVTSPPFRGVSLPHGAVMDAPEFPMLLG